MLDFSSGWVFFGILGIIIAGIYRISQINKLRKTKNSNDISFRSVVLQTFAYVSFFLYILFYFDPILFIYYILSLIQNGYILYLIQKYRNIENKVNNETEIEDNTPNNSDEFVEISL